MRRKVTLVVAMRNEEASIEACLESIERQRYPAADLEVFVVDGNSTDRSREIAESIVARHSGWYLLDNPRRIQAVAWNMGIERASGEVIGIVSGHAELAEDYVGAAVETLQRTGAAMVGGPVTAMADGAVAVAIAAATSSPFGVGGARHHYLTIESETDTVFMALAPRDIYRAFRFDEQMVRNQDDELSYRVIDAGHRIVCNPAIRSWYRVRSDLAGLARQYWSYGYWKVAVLRRHPHRARFRHILPAVTVAASTGALVAAVGSRRARAAIILGATPYLSASAVLAARHARRWGSGSGLALFLVYPTMHVCYGAGFIAGLGDTVRRARESSNRRSA